MVIFLSKNQSTKIESEGYMSSSSYLARLAIYQNSNIENAAVDTDNTESNLKSQTGENSVDSLIVENTQLNDDQVD